MEPLRTRLWTLLLLSLSVAGLATFVATARDTSVGAPLAVAIAIHNIPEGAALDLAQQPLRGQLTPPAAGICVAVPIYFASQSRWKAFMWGTLSGVAEPIAGGFGWAILSRSGTSHGNTLRVGRRVPRFQGAGCRPAQMPRTLTAWRMLCSSAWWPA